jgi:hypothetical protein
MSDKTLMLIICFVPALLTAFSISFKIDKKRIIVYAVCTVIAFIIYTPSPTVYRKWLGIALAVGLYVYTIYLAITKK